MARHADLLGNPVTLAEAASLGPVDDFVGGFIACEARAVNILQAAVDPSPLVQAYCAALHMFAESRDAPANARPFIARALASPLAASAQEQRFVRAVAAWVDGDIPQAIRLHEEQAQEHPRDLASVKLGQYHLFNRGEAPGMLRLALAALPAAGDVPYLHGMLAFGYEQCHWLTAAEQAARRAIAMCRKEPWAHHALAHVMLTEGRLAEGQAFLREHSDGWTGLNSFMVTHNWWHAALFTLELDDAAEVLRLYDEQVWGVAKDYSQDQINAVSLLARLELAGVDVGRRWQDLAQHLATRTHDQVMPFLDMQYLYGLARAERPEAQALLAQVQAKARAEIEAATQTSATPAGSAHPGRDTWQQVWAQVCLPACQGLLAHARGDWAGASTALGRALPRLAEVGGSHAQRDLFEQLHLDALVRSGQYTAAQQLLQPRLARQPESLRLHRQAHGVYQGLGLDAAWLKVNTR